MDYNNYNNYTSPEPPKNSFAKTSMILGIIALVTGVISAVLPCCAPIPLISALLGIIFGFVSRKPGEAFAPQAIIGIICNAVAIVFIILAAIFLIAFMNSAAGQEMVAEYMKYYQEIMEGYDAFYNN